MKKIKLTTILLTGLCMAASAQNKKLPAKVTITLTEQQVIQFDQAIKEGAKAIDSKAVEQQYSAVFKPFYDQVNAQMVADTVKKREPVKKP